MTSDSPKRRKTDAMLPKADLSDPALHTAKELRRSLRVLIVLTVVLYVILGGVAFYTYQLGQKNKRALCTIRANAQTRADATQDFLLRHPNGIPGVTVLDLNRSINAYRATVHALDDVNCTSTTP
jgi:hypothetical protein